MAVYEPGSRPSLRQWLCQCLYLAHPASRNMRNKYSLFTPPSLGYFYYSSLMDWDGGEEVRTVFNEGKSDIVLPRLGHTHHAFYDTEGACCCLNLWKFQGQVMFFGCQSPASQEWLVPNGDLKTRGWELCAGSVTLYLLINGQKRDKKTQKYSWLHKKRRAKCPASCCENSGFWYVSLIPLLSMIVYTKLMGWSWEMGRWSAILWVWEKLTVIQRCDEIARKWMWLVKRAEDWASGPHHSEPEPERIPQKRPRNSRSWKGEPGERDQPLWAASRVSVLQVPITASPHSPHNPASSWAWQCPPAYKAL